MNVRNLTRSSTVELGPRDYRCLIAPREWRVVNAIHLLRAVHTSLAEEPRVLPVMSLRLSTGIIGELDCPAGNRGPKNPSEVIIGLGTTGIAGLIELGGLPCVACHSGKRLATMERPIPQILTDNIGGTIDHADDPSWLTSHYDARRLDWLQILDRVRSAPGRFYTRPGLNALAVEEIAESFVGIPNQPHIGFYNATIPERFTEYEIVA